MTEKQEIHCHNCNRYVQFDMDLSLNGNHVLHCPNCNHEHCRVVKDGVITDDRWDQRNGNTFTITASTCTITSTYTTYMSVSTTGSVATSGSVFLYNSWMDSITTA
jgi:hypothetical protein